MARPRVTLAAQVSGPCCLSSSFATSPATDALLRIRVRVPQILPPVPAGGLLRHPAHSRCPLGLKLCLTGLSADAGL